MRRGLVAMLAFGLLGMACGDDGDDGGKKAADTAGTTTLRVGYIPSSGLAPTYLGIQHGFFKAQRLNLKLVPGPTAAALVAQAVSGQLDISYSPVPTLLAAVSRGAKLKVISSFDGDIDPKEASSAIMVLPDSPIKRPRDLQGKKVAVIALQALLDVVMHAAVARDGGDQSKVKSVQIPFPQMYSALKAGRVDAIVSSEPFMTIAKQQGARTISEPEVEVVPDATAVAYVASEKFIGGNADVIERFQAAMRKSLDYAKAHTDEARAAIPKFTQIKPGLAKIVKLGLIYNSTINQSSFEAVGKLMRDLGYLQQVPAAAELIHK